MDRDSFRKINKNMLGNRGAEYKCIFKLVKEELILRYKDNVSDFKLIDNLIEFKVNSIISATVVVINHSVKVTIDTGSKSVVDKVDELLNLISFTLSDIVEKAIIADLVKSCGLDLDYKDRNILNKLIDAIPDSYVLTNVSRSKNSNILLAIASFRKIPECSSASISSKGLPREILVHQETDKLVVEGLLYKKIIKVDL